ncbi:MAG: Crp/Fnr family transcriptional regulator [Coriobacteriia bacterium]|nr:Crp/Fnr family transcriptional regulator [Coriobacteriia bacterium]
MRKTRLGEREIFETVKRNSLFADVAYSDFVRMFDCLSAKTYSYRKGELVLTAGDHVDFFGIVLKGSVRVIREDIHGNAAVISEQTATDSFAEVFACAGVTQSPVSVLAMEKTEVLMISSKRLLETCTNSCPYHVAMIGNLIRTIANKAIDLSQRVEMLSKRTTREKLMSYLELYRGAAQRFEVPHNRTELARFLSVDRSAMSKELARMRDEGVIRFERNSFEILDDEG